MVVGSLSQSAQDEEIRRAHQARLRLLQVRAAREGWGTPPEVLNEIADIRRILGQAEEAGAAESMADLGELGAVIRAVMLVSAIADETRRKVDRLFLLLPLYLLLAVMFMWIVSRL